MTHQTRSPLTLGWEAARANALPALIIQALMLMLLVSFYTSHTAFALLSQLAELKRTRGILFVVIASVAAGALIPELSSSSSEDARVAGIFVICCLPYPSGDSMERWSTFYIEVKQLGSETWQRSRWLRRKFASINLVTILFSQPHLVC